MSKAKIKRYRCAECGAISLTWSGRCQTCGGWGTLFEEKEEDLPGRPRESYAKKITLSEVGEIRRFPTGIDELDRVLGGGWVEGGVVLLGGEPGVGKSTLLLQSAISMAEGGKKVLYVSGEESPSQVAMRAKRLNARDGNLFLLCTDDINEALQAAGDVEFLFLDSVQTMRDRDEGGWPGSPLQVRVVAQKWLCYPAIHFGKPGISKKSGIPGYQLIPDLIPDSWNHPFSFPVSGSTLTGPASSCMLPEPSEFSCLAAAPRIGSGICAARFAAGETRFRL